MSIYAFPQLGGVKLRSVYLVPRASDVATATVVFTGSRAWYTLEYQWGTGHVSDPWATWIKPQIDFAVSVGANCVSLLFDAGLRVGASPHLTLGQMTTIVDQIATYCAALGVWFFPSGTDAHNYQEHAISSANYQTYLTEFAGLASAHRNVLSVVSVDEIDVPSGGALTGTEWGNRALWIAATKAGLQRSVPVTCTLGDYVPFVWARAASLVTAGADYAAYNYFQSGTPPSVSDFTPLFFNAGGGASGTTDVAVVVTSSGILYNGNATTAAAFYDGMKAVADHARCQLFTAWSATDFGAVGVGDFGLANTSFAARTAETTRLAQFPIAPDAYDATEDTGAISPGAPTITARHATSLSLSWSAATGGTAPYIYRTEYAPLDANGFPTADWANGGVTGGLSHTIANLLAGQSYAVRVMTTDAS